MKLVCSRCGDSHIAEDPPWRCPCGGPWVLQAQVEPPVPDISQRGVWRWHRSLPPLAADQRVSLGEGGTPLVPARVDGADLLAKCDFVNPTGSWKDRGWTVAVSRLRQSGHTRLYEDSSGNAGASLAAYGARAGLSVTVMVPHDSPDPKRRQIAAYGAEVVPVPGGRDAVAAACIEAAGAGVYAGHAWNPWFAWGPRTLAWEIHEELSGQLPAAVVTPVGQGGILLGLSAGFAALRDAGLIRQPPLLVAAQAAACAPVVIGLAEGAPQPPPIRPEPTLADAIRTPRPARYGEIMAALGGGAGEAIAVSEEEIGDAHRQLAHLGLLVEPTSAVAVAAAARWRHAHPRAGAVVAILTGSGLKTLG